MVNLKQRSFLTLKDVTGKEIRFLIRLESDLKAAKRGGYERHAKFMHCLPACHNTDTEVGEKIQEKFDLTEME